MRGSWNVESIILKDQVLEVRNVEGQLHVAIDYGLQGTELWEMRRRRPAVPTTLLVRADEVIE